MKKPLERILFLIEKLNIPPSETDELIKNLMEIQPNEILALPEEIMRNLEQLLTDMLILDTADSSLLHLSPEEKVHLGTIQKVLYSELQKLNPQG